MTVLYTIASFLVAIIILVGVHEFGHFYIARRCGVKVLRFSLGFGKVLWRRYDRQGTEYTLAALPFGGYVKMLDEREGNVAPELLDQTFNRKTVWQRMAIVLAGPVANFLLAILLFWALLLRGEGGYIPVIGGVAPDSLAARAGLEVGQEITAVDGQPTATAQAVEKQLLKRLGESGELSFTVQYPTQSTLQYEIKVPLDKWLQGAEDPSPLEGLGLTIPLIKAVVGEIVADSPAARAGFLPGDKIVRVADSEIKDWRDFQKVIRPLSGQAVAVVVERKSAAGLLETLSLSVTPESFTEKGVSYGRVGLGLQPLGDDQIRRYEHSVVGALVAGVKKTWETSGIVLLSIKKLILGEISTKNLSGPITIAKVAGSSAHHGLETFVGFVAFLSVSLGVFNLLPIPVLDGGHLLYLYVEAIRRKPVSEKIQVVATQIGFIVVIGLSILALYNDILRL